MGEENTRHTYIEILKTVGTYAGIAAMLYSAFVFIDWRIEKKIKSPEFIQKIASNVRPSVIFDSQQSIEIEMGAMQFIENITVIPSDDLRFPKEIIISPKKYLAHAPFLSSLDRVEFHMQVERGKKYDWIYHLSLSEHPSDIKKTRFRLEILQ